VLSVQERLTAELDTPEAVRLEIVGSAVYVTAAAMRERRAPLVPEVARRQIPTWKSMS